MRLTYFTCGLLVILVACHSGSEKKKNNGEPASASAALPEDPMKGQQEALQKQAAELAIAHPGNPDKLKAMLPVTLMGGTRLSAESLLYEGVPTAKARYQINDSIVVQLALYDCAGTTGADFYTNRFVALTGRIGETGNSYIRGVELGAYRGFEQGDKQGRSCRISWLVNRRYLAQLEGTRIGAPALRQAASSLHF